MAINSRQKGKAGELEFAAFLREHGHDARRGVQYSGGPGSPDVVSKSLGFLHFEVKRVEQLNIHNAMSQAQRDCGPKVPAVFHRKNRHDWLVTMTATDFLNFVAGAKT